MAGETLEFNAGCGAARARTVCRPLKARQRSGEIPLRDYATHVEDLKARFPLLSVPLPSWVE